MMTRKTHQPRSFVDSFVHGIEQGYREAGVRALVPTYFLITILLPTIVVLAVRDVVAPISNETLVMALSAIMTIEGILAAVSVSAMVQVQQIVCEYPFSDYLEEEELFDSFIFIPQFTFVVQCLSAVSCVAAIVYVQLSSSYQLVLLVVCAGVFAYTMVRTLALVDLIRVLSWHYARYQMTLEEERDKASQDSE